MPSFSASTVVFFLFLVMTTTTTTIGGNVRKIKHSKKTNANANANTCLSRLLGKSQYTNCVGTETELDIACANKDTAAPAAANTTLTERLLCLYSEHPVQYEQDELAAAATPQPAVADCGVHGSFDPLTHITLDHATGVCRLNFFALTDSCDAAAPVAANDGFGVMVEALLSTDTDMGSHNHEPTEDTNHKDNSGLLLWFSMDNGVTYYNSETPRETVPFDDSSPRRKLNHNDNPDPCVPACIHTDSFGGYSCTHHERDVYFETCYRFDNTMKYCWTRSFYDADWCHNSYDPLNRKFRRCAPHGSDWLSVENEDVTQKLG